MNNEDIVKYCTTSPENINPAVLRSMLSSVEGGGGNVMILNVEYILKPDTGNYLATITNYTVDEINEAYLSGKILICKYENQEYNHTTYRNVCLFGQGPQEGFDWNICALSDGNTDFSNEADPMVYAQEEME